MSEEIIFDGSHQIMGRFASKVAGELLDGNEVTVVNANELVITGKPRNIIDEYLKRKRRGDPHHGPYYPKEPKSIFRRAVRGMLPYKKSKGKKAFRRLKVFNNNPEDKKGERIAKDRNEVTCQHISLGDLSKRLKGE
ncbi:MAG: 50S ribosomal protein L13 [Candidatus Aenigmatarchaeota archaeon]